LAGCPALASWSPATLAAKAGEATVRVMAGRAGDPNPHARQETNWVELPFAAWLAEIQGEASDDRYMVAANRNLDRPDLAPLLADLAQAPRFVAPDPPAASCALWLGPAGTRTGLHRDPHPVLLAQAFGRKRFWLLQPRDQDLLAIEDGYYAPMDLSQGGPPGAEVLVAELGPGEALYIPWDWWHQARALEAGASITFAKFLEPEAAGVQGPA
jgi:ribosomal protein L16 Arg81 hydroxylase